MEVAVVRWARRIAALEQSLAEMDAAHVDALSPAGEELRRMEKRRDALEAGQGRERGDLVARLKKARATA